MTAGRGSGRPGSFPGRDSFKVTASAGRPAFPWCMLAGRAVGLAGCVGPPRKRFPPDESVLSAPKASFQCRPSFCAQFLKGGHAPGRLPLDSKPGAIA